MFRILLRIAASACASGASAFVASAAWAAWGVFVRGQGDPKFGDAWGNYRFLLGIAALLSLVTALGALVGIWLTVLRLETLSLARRLAASLIAGLASAASFHAGLTLGLTESLGIPELVSGCAVSAVAAVGAVLLMPRVGRFPSRRQNV